MNDEKGFTVSDHRSVDKGQAPEQQAETNAASGQAPSASAGSEHNQDAGALAEIDFATFVLSLATSAQMNLGSIPHPETNQASQNMPAAKQMIDILGMLKEKTKGNLNKDEETLLEQVLFNLRMHYVRISEGQKKSGGS